jgi:hypothetical protein
MKSTIDLDMLRSEDVLFLNDRAAPATKPGLHRKGLTMGKSICACGSENLTLFFWENPMTRYHSRGRLYSSPVDKYCGVFFKKGFKEGYAG